MIELIIIVAIILLAIGIIVYDTYKYRYTYSTTKVILRCNDERIRNIIEASGIDLCWCTKIDRNNMLMSTSNGLVCGFNEDKDHILSKAKSNKVRIIDCGVSVKKFIYEIQNLKK